MILRRYRLLFDPILFLSLQQLRSCSSIGANLNAQRSEYPIALSNFVHSTDYYLSSDIY